jgi:hypothetical protein
MAIRQKRMKELSGNTNLVGILDDCDLPDFRDLRPFKQSSIAVNYTVDCF